MPFKHNGRENNEGIKNHEIKHTPDLKTYKMQTIQAILMPFREKYRISFKIWLEQDGKPFLGEGGAEILKHIEKYESLSRTAEKLSMSYRYVWGYVKRIERVLDAEVVETYKGGRAGGGGARLTRLGKDLLREYEQLERRSRRILSGKTSGGERIEDQCKKPFQRESRIR